MLKQALLVACLTLLPSVPAHCDAAGSDEPERIDFTHVFAAGEAADQPAAAPLIAITHWLSRHFDLPGTAPPRVERVAPERLHALRYRAFPMVAGPAPQPGPLGEGRAVVAVYDDARQVIYLPQGWTGASPAEQSMLVHEMVHHLQNRSGLRFECPQQREKLAYEAQARWLARTGDTLESAFEIDAMTLLVHVNCLL